MLPIEAVHPPPERFEQLKQRTTLTRDRTLTQDEKSLILSSIGDEAFRRYVLALYGDKIHYADRPYGALEGADGLVMTEWPEFRNPDFGVM